METKVIKYSGYKYFCNDTFRESLKNIFFQNVKYNYDDHYNNIAISCKSFLGKITQWKNKFVSGNHSPFMNQAISKEIMVRTKLRNTFLKSQNEVIKKHVI